MPRHLASRKRALQLLCLIALGLAAACAPDSPESRLVLADGGVPIVCSEGRAPEFAAVATAEGSRRGFHQAAFTDCSFELEVPADARLVFRVSVGPVDYMRGRGARAVIVSGTGEELFARDLGGLAPVFAGSIELSAGRSQLSLRSAAVTAAPETGGLTWTDLELVARAPDPGPAWIVDADRALAPYLVARSPTAGKRRRLLVIGMDGGSWSLMRHLIERGEMPTLAALRDRGSWGVLRSTPIPASAMSWAALATGANPGRTGVFTASGLPPARPAFWDLVANRGAIPLLASVPGASIDGPGVRIGEAEEGPWAQPAELEPLLARAGYMRRPVTVREARRVIDQMNRRADVVSALLRGVEWDLAFFVFRHTDAVARRFGLYTDAWRASTQAFDANLGKLLRSVDSRTTVLLVSSHGWRYFDRSVQLNAWLAKNGLPGWKLGLPAAGNAAMISQAWRGPAGLRDLEAGLAKLLDSDTRENVIRSTQRTAEAFPGRFSSSAPGQLVVEAQPEYLLMLGEAGPRRARIFQGSADGPSRDGIYLLAGPGVEAGEGPERSLYDVAPSVLRFFGVEPPPDLDGTSLPELAPALQSRR